MKPRSSSSRTPQKYRSASILGDGIRPRPVTVGGVRSKTNHRVRYAVVGLGHIAQVAVLPAFANARKNSQLVALVSDTPKKTRALGARYNVKDVYDYDGYEACLHSGKVDAVYIALPNSMHAEFAVRAANAGVHVLCEKPLAVTEHECEQIIRACADNKVKLMTAYRLHFEKANLEAIKVLQSGKLGDPRIFSSVFTMQVREGNIRTQRELGGGTLYDIGIYCINAARYLFRSEPTEVVAFSTEDTDKRFSEIDEMTSAVMRFPEGRLASFTSSFGAADEAIYEVVGTKGKLQMKNAYEYQGEIEMTVEIKGKKQRRTFSRRDQFAPELLYFSDCIQRDKLPEPSGVEGLVDVHIVRALYESAHSGRPVTIGQLRRDARPEPSQEIHRPPVKKAQLVGVTAPTRD